jgi:hypothetical protein
MRSTNSSSSSDGGGGGGGDGDDNNNFPSPLSAITHNKQMYFHRKLRTFQAKQIL